jgi:hypothetical protein
MGRSIESLMLDSRSWIRDFPVFFTASSPAVTTNNRTINLSHPNVLRAGLHVWATDGSATVEGAPDTIEAQTGFTYLLDERNGMMRIGQAPSGGFPANMHINVEGYYVNWVADQDLKFHITNVIAEFAYGQAAWTLDDISDVEADLIALQAASEVLFSLLVQYSRDIDVTTPQAMHIPATQRFHQVHQMLYGPGGLAAKVKEKQDMLGVGLGRAEVGTLRRVSRTTNRLVPVYVVREYDDISRPRRLFTEPDAMGQFNPPTGFTPGRKLIEAVTTEEPNP